MADYKRVAEVFKAHPRITVKKVHGNPPEKYEAEYQVRSLVSRGGKVESKSTHLVEIQLPLGYPRQAPVCRMLTPVFHPNIAPHAVCIGDHWAAGESLVHLMVRIGEMLAYQSYNIKSPLNGEAARWADEHKDDLPTDTTDLSPEKRPEEIAVDGTAAAAPLPVATAVPVAKAVPVATAVPVARPIQVAKPLGQPGAAPPPAPGQPAAVHKGPVRMTCRSCGRTRIATQGSAFNERCMYCGGEMVITWKG